MILTYYWPPSGGSGVQRWMYFAKHLKQLGWEPIVITVDENKASYSVFDTSLNSEVNNIRVIKTKTREPLQWYSILTTGSKQKGIPQGEIKKKSILGKLAAFIRGNFFIPDARVGWVPFALQAARKIIIEEDIKQIITTGPPHSSHLIGLQLQKEFSLEWFVDFRDPWSDLFYNQDLYRLSRAVSKDLKLEKEVLLSASGVITTVGGVLHANLESKAPNQKFYNIPNGYDAELMDAVVAEKENDVFHVVYTGLLTRNQSYTSVFNILNELAINQSIRLSLAGNISSDIIEEIKDRFANIDVIYKGYLSHQEAIHLMKSAHMLLNFIFVGAQTQMISGKILEYLATEVPLLSIGKSDSDAAKLIEQGSASVMFEVEDTESIRVFIEQVHSKKGRLKNKFPKIDQWSRSNLTRRLLEEVLS